MRNLHTSEREARVMHVSLFCHYSRGKEQEMLCLHHPANQNPSKAQTVILIDADFIARSMCNPHDTYADAHSFSFSFSFQQIANSQQHFINNNTSRMSCRAPPIINNHVVIIVALKLLLHCAVCILLCGSLLLCLCSPAQIAFVSI